MTFDKSVKKKKKKFLKGFQEFLNKHVKYHKPTLIATNGIINIQNRLRLALILSLDV